jgi:hypothetical protein
MRLGCWTVLAMLTLTPGCASAPDPTPLDRATIRSIESGGTTQAQIEQWFGAPTDVKVKPSDVIWRYERRFLELERPGPARHAVCSTLGALPVVQLPLYWFRQCDEIERLEKLEVRFSAERIVTSLEFDEDLVPFGAWRGRLPYPDPIPIPRARGSDVASAAGS